MRESRKLDKVLKSIAEVSSESASFFGVYEPQMPEQLLKQKKENRNQTVNKNV